MKYKYSLPARLKSMVEWQLEHYPEDKRQLEKAKDDLIPSPVAALSWTSGVDGGQTRREAEETAFRIASSQYVRHIEFSCQAIQKALNAEDDLTRRIVELVYWRREYTAEGAGMVLNLSRPSVYRRINNLLSRIAYEMGYISL